MVSYAGRYSNLQPLSWTEQMATMVENLQML